MPTKVGRVPLALHKPPGRGTFAFAEDRNWVALVMRRMIRSKLQHYLKYYDFHSYRFLCNIQHHYLEGLEVDPIEGLLPRYRGDIDPLKDPVGFATANFLHKGVFKTVSEVDAAGWSPLCYAVVNGDIDVVKALIQSRADCNEVTRKGSMDKFLASKLPMLSLAAAYHSNDVMKVLLSLACY